MRTLFMFCALFAMFSACFPDYPKDVGGDPDTSADATETAVDAASETSEPEIDVDTREDAAGETNSQGETHDIIGIETTPADVTEVETGSEVVDPECDDSSDCSGLIASCQAGACESGRCVARPLDATGCDDNNACTTNDTCDAGSCMGLPVVCSPIDVCHAAGECIASTGECSNPPITGASVSCNDGLACTTNDACSSGTCAGSAVVCTALDQCHDAGVCVEASGACTNPAKSDTSQCDDGDRCTAQDFCEGGECSGSAVGCPASSNPCLIAGCDGATGECLNVARQEGSQCDDSNACTSTDSCQAGVCIGVTVTCVDQGECAEPVTCVPERGCVVTHRATGTSCTAPIGGSCRNGACGLKALALGETHTCMRMQDNRLKCWGSGGNGALGYGDSATIGDDESPGDKGDSLGGAPVEDVAAFGDTTCVVHASGHVSCFGFGGRGQLGLGALPLQYGTDDVPTRTVSLVDTAKSLAGGRNHICAVLTGGRIQCWGAGDFGQLGYGTEYDVSDPAAVGLVNLGKSVRNVYATAFRTCVITASSTPTAICWGLNDSGQLGYGHTEDVGDNEEPVAAGELELGMIPEQLALSQFATCALDYKGDVKCWGPGPLGYGIGSGVANIGDDETPSAIGFVPLGGKASAIAANLSTICAAMVNGDVKCWGNDTHGVMGPHEARTSAIVDIPLDGPTQQIFLGGWHACAVGMDSTLRCWGSNISAELGYPGLPRGQGLGLASGDLPPTPVDTGP